MTEEFREEYTKCLESAAYFYNNYVLFVDKNGNKYKPQPISDEFFRFVTQQSYWYSKLRQRK